MEYREKFENLELDKAFDLQVGIFCNSVASCKPKSFLMILEQNTPSVLKRNANFIDGQFRTQSNILKIKHFKDIDWMSLSKKSALTLQLKIISISRTFQMQLIFHDILIIETLQVFCVHYQAYFLSKCNHLLIF